MSRARMVFFFLAVGALPPSAAGVIAAQEPSANTQAEAKPQPALASLKVCLRLQDDTPFLGTVSVRVLPEEGYELIGTPAQTPGDYLFPEVAPGKYFVEVSAPGFLAARLSTQVEPGHRQKTMFVLMKPRELPNAAGNPEEAATNLPVGSLPAATASVASLPALPASSPPPEADMQRNFWRPHELEEDVPRVDASVPCPTQDILQGVAQRMNEFVGTLEKFTATENVEHYTVTSSGARKSPEKRNFVYVVTVTQGKGGRFLIDEFRNGGTDVGQFPAHIATQGLPAIALIFHPLLATDFDFRCEGLGQWQGREAWQIHFAQRADRPVRIRSYYVGFHIYPVQLQGRVWIDPGNDQVVRLESELANPIPEIDLKSEHLIIEYKPVEFHSTGQKVWLPDAAELYVDRQGKRYYRRHSFSDFKLFNVETAQSFQVPKGSYSFTNTSDQDVTGELTVIPQAGTKHETVTLRFTVPAHGRVFKTVGQGKEVDLPPAAVASATFVHNGVDGSVKVDALLIRETTLDVVPETPLPQTP